MESISNHKPQYSPFIFFCVLIPFFIIAYKYATYMLVAKSTVPIMDYWHWIAVFGQRVLDGTITFKDYFASDAGEHIQPIGMAINFIVLDHSHFDVQPLVTYGMVFRILLALSIVVYFLHSYRNNENNLIILTLCTTVIGFSVINYNQWEMTSEPFSLSNVFRVWQYFVTFYVANRFVSGIRQRSHKRNLLYGFLFGLYSAFTTILVGASYFIGHLPAIGFSLLWAWFANRKEWKSYFWPLAIWAFISFISACVYYVLVSQRGVSTPGVELQNSFFVHMLEGIIYFWGAAFLHTTVIETYGATIYAIIGTATLFYGVVISIRYMAVNKEDTNIFPLICFLYAVIVSLGITWGRINRFGVETMISSRYVIESSIGLVGICWMTYDVYVKGNKTFITTFQYVLISLFAFTMLFSAALKEEEIAPYRKIYYENLAAIMIDIDNYADNELGEFQATKSSDIRYCIDLFKDNNLSIFYNPNSDE